MSMGGSSALDTEQALDKVMTRVIVGAYNTEWPLMFERIRSYVWPAVTDVAINVEHVGSTAVPELAAKPVIDATIVVATRAQVPLGIKRLAELGYVHRGNLGVEDREAFAQPEGLPRHNLYLSPLDGLSLRSHLGLRDYLRAHPHMAKQYGELKMRLAERFADDTDRYVDGKTEFILEVLRQIGLSQDELAAIERINRLA